MALDVLVTAAMPVQSPEKKRRKESEATPVVPHPAPVCSPRGTLQSPPKSTHITYKKLASRLGLSVDRIKGGFRREKELTAVEKKTYLGDIRKWCNKRQVCLPAGISARTLVHCRICLRYRGACVSPLPRRSLKR